MPADEPPSLARSYVSVYLSISERCASNFTPADGIKTARLWNSWLRYPVLVIILLSPESRKNPERISKKMGRSRAAIYVRTGNKKGARIKIQPRSFV